MPTKPPRACATPGCPALVQGGHCPAHAKSRNRSRGKTTERGYGGDWQVMRAAQLKREPLCAVDLARGYVVEATVADHKTPWRTGATPEERERLRTDPKNLQSLCAACHNRKTATEDGGFGRGRVATVSPAVVVVDGQPRPGFNLKLGCAHGRLPGQPCPHCLGICSCPGGHPPK